MSTSGTPSLASCMLMDGLGMISYIIPVIGEGFDFIWAFISASVFYGWFGSKAGTISNVCEELLPFTDFVPSFTIGHFLCDGK